MTKKEERLTSALKLILARFKQIKPTSRTALYIESILGRNRKKCAVCKHLVVMHSGVYNYCVHPVGFELCKCEG